MTMHEYEAVVVGAGGAGLYAALEASRGARTAVVSKLHPMRSHTGAAQGGIGAALGNLEEDKPEWHAFDTVKGGDYLVDQGAAVILADDAVRAVYDLENRGLPFSRTPQGKIDQRRFGGHTRNHGEAPVRRSCYAADRTGHMILQTLYQQCIKNEVAFFDEFQVVDVLLEGGRAAGLVALELATGELHVFRAKAAALRHRRLRADVPHHLQRLRQHRRRAGAAGPPRGAPGGHGVLPVPPHRHPGPGHPDHRGGARRGRHPAQPPGGAFHGALRAHAAGPGAPGHDQPGHHGGDPGRQRGARRPAHRRLRVPGRHAPRQDT